MKKRELKKRIEELQEDIRCFRSSKFTDKLRVQIKYDMIERTDKLIWSEDLTKECTFDGLMPVFHFYPSRAEL